MHGMKDIVKKLESLERNPVSLCVGCGTGCSLAYLAECKGAVKAIAQDDDGGWIHRCEKHHCKEEYSA